MSEADDSLVGLTRLRRLFLGKRKNRATRPMRQLVVGDELGVVVMEGEVEQKELDFPSSRPQQGAGPR